MPIYEYRCQACGHQLEVLQKMSEAALTDCPACQKPALQKIVSATGFQLKGTGWYVTDFRDNDKKPPKPAAGADTAEPTKTTEESKPSTETKATSDKPAASAADTAKTETKKPAE